jgi:predicted GNAT family N-acyltransferase
MNNSRRRESINTVENAKLYTAFKKEVEPYFKHKDTQSGDYDFPTLVDILKSIDICRLDPDYVKDILVTKADIIIACIDESEKVVYGFRTMRFNKSYETNLVLDGGIFCTNSNTYVGIGHKIMCSSIKLALQNNIKEMRVESVEATVGFYKKYGFKSQSEINNNTNYNIEKILANDYNHFDDFVKMKLVDTETS